MRSSHRRQYRRLRFGARNQSMKIFKIEHGQLAYRLDLILHATSPVLLALAILIHAPLNHRKELLVFVVLGVISWSLIEYLLHRFILHGVAPFKRWHDEHHQRPMALICLPTAFSIGLIFTLVFLPGAWLLGAWHAGGLTLGVLMGYAAYSFVHHATHHSQSQNVWFRKRRRHHALHHAMHKKNDRAIGHFGVTSNFWDRIFRTLTV